MSHSSSHHSDSGNSSASVREAERPKFGFQRFAITVLAHVAFLVLAYYVVVSVITPKEKETLVFSPVGSGGGSPGPKHNVRQKQHRVTHSANLPRISSATSVSAISLPPMPDIPADPFASFSMASGGRMGGGGGSGGGIGSGVGSGIGPGVGMRGARGFVSTFFGALGTPSAEGLRGSFYDLKQDSRRRSTNFVNEEATYAKAINESADRRFSRASLRDYYKAEQEMLFTFLAVPANLSADEAPKAFNVEKEVQPNAWFIHYSGLLTPTSTGPWRFVGFFDDALIVYINGKPVLDGSWYPIVGHGDTLDPEIRQEIAGANISGTRRPYAGKWIRITKDTRIDIIVGERPGGLVGGVLCIEQQGETYDKQPDGTPILPLFSTKVLDKDDKERISQFAAQSGFPIADKTPFFSVQNPK